MLHRYDVWQVSFEMFFLYWYNLSAPENFTFTVPTLAVCCAPLLSLFMIALYNFIANDILVQTRKQICSITSMNINTATGFIKMKLIDVTRGSYNAITQQWTYRIFIQCLYDCFIENPVTCILHPTNTRSNIKWWNEWQSGNSKAGRFTPVNILICNCNIISITSQHALSKSLNHSWACLPHGIIRISSYCKVVWCFCVHLLFICKQVTLSCWSLIMCGLCTYLQ